MYPYNLCKISLMIFFVRNGRSRILKGFKIQNRNINVPNLSATHVNSLITLRKKNVSCLYTSQDKVQIHNENDNLK